VEVENRNEIASEIQITHKQRKEEDMKKADCRQTAVSSQKTEDSRQQTADGRQ
jgi:hypothetical protein